MKRSWRYYVSEFFSSLSDICLDLAMRISNNPPPKMTEDESMGFNAMVMNRVKSRCPFCRGERVLHTATGDTYVCDKCQGSGLNVAEMFLKMLPGEEE